MNKKTLKIAGWALGLSMAVTGIGAVAGMTAKAPVEVKATLANTYVKVNASASTLDTTQKYFLSPDGAKFARAAISSSALQFGDTESQFGLVSFTECTPATTPKKFYMSITSTIDEKQVTVKIGNSSSTNISDTNSKWTIVVPDPEEPEEYYLSNTENSGRFLGMTNNTHTAAKAYATTNLNSYDKVFLYQISNAITGDTEAYSDETVDLSCDAPTPSWSVVAGAETTAEGATIDSDGKLSVTGAGTVKVKAAQDGYQSAYYTVSFTEKPTMPYIIPDSDSESGYTGQNDVVSFSYGLLTGALSVASDDESVVTVGDPSMLDGKGTVQLNYVGAGSTTVKFKDGASVLSSVTVTVTASSVTITGLASSKSLYVGNTLDLGSTITVTSLGSYSTDVTWESEDKTVATVDDSGIVTGVGTGTVDITVTSDDYPSAMMTCSVTVNARPLEATYNFASNFATYASSWTNSYGEHTDLAGVEDLGGDFEATINLYQASKQTGTITTMPVFANKNNSDTYSKVVEFTLTEDGYRIDDVLVTFSQWGSKTPSAKLIAGADISATPADTVSITDEDLTLSGENLNIKQFCVSYSGGDTKNNTQLGLSSIYITLQKSWSRILLEQFTCSGAVDPNVNPTGAYVTAANNGLDAWSTASAAFSGLTPTEKAALKTKAANEAGTFDEQALARYDLVVSKYGTGTYSDFLGRFSEGGIHYGAARTGGFNISTGIDSNFPLIVTILSAGVLAAGGFFLIQRKRRDQE